VINRDLDYEIEASVHRGIEDMAAREIRMFLERNAVHAAPQAGVIRFVFRGHLQELLRLRTVSSPYLVLRFVVPRPKALLGDQHLRRILDAAQEVLRLSPQGSFRTLHLSAAGADSPVMRRLVSEIAGATGLREDPEEGNLQVRVRKSRDRPAWEVLTRLSPRPLSARPWRVCNLQGGLNASIAAAMVMLTEPKPSDTYLNPCCGSGTLLIERAAEGKAGQIIGADTSLDALNCARQNIAASGRNGIEIQQWDARLMPLPDGSVDAICADLPFGHTVGSHAENRELHGDMLRDCARVARPHARACFLTHQAGMMAELLRDVNVWTVQRQNRIELAGLKPTLFVLARQ
jgi:23S rRNA G2445 N2-methylase RlmL